MIGYVDVSEQVDKDFHRALRKASLHRWKEKLRIDSYHEGLLSFDEAKSALVHSSQAYRGMRVVEVEKIIGSVGRYKDFDSSFLPHNRSMSPRWSRVDSAYHKGVDLPAVSLYKIGEAYFVRDGNHRVSVARFHKVAAIDAEVVELRGQMRNEAAQSTARVVGFSPQGPRDPARPRAPRLVNLWQRLRPGLWRPEVRPLAWE